MLQIVFKFCSLIGTFHYKYELWTLFFKPLTGALNKWFNYDLKEDTLKAKDLLHLSLYIRDTRKKP